MCILNCFNMFFGFLGAKPCRIMRKSPQQATSRPETHNIYQNVGIWSRPNLSRKTKARIESEKAAVESQAGHESETQTNKWADSVRLIGEQKARIETEKEEDELYMKSAPNRPACLAPLRPPR